MRGEWQAIFNWLLGIISVGVGWILKRQSAHERRISELEVLVAGQYITRSEFTRAIDALREERQRTSDSMFVLLRRIEDKLDRKVDKE